MFSVRIVTANHYQAQPIRDLDVAYSDFRGSEVKQVPVLRIFGATPVGQKTCLHIHGVFPYIYVGCGPQDFATDKDLRQFATSLDLALQVAMGQASGNTQHVFKVVSVQAVPMYGYHSRSQRFLKVYFYNPLMVKRAVELLQSGAVMNRVFQPHEAHIPFILQFFMDYNLYGMNLIHLAAIKFRKEKEGNDSNSEKSTPDTQPVNLSAVLSSGSLSSQKWTRDNIPSGLLLDAEVQRQSVCELEVDAVAMDILNRLELQGNTEMNPGLLAIYNEERERREVKGQMDYLHPPPSPDRGVIEDTESEVNGKARLADIIQQQLGELRALAGGEEEEEDTQSVLQDTMAEPSLTASQLILHDSQYAGEDSEVVPEDSQPVVNEELVQSLVEASQRSSQYSQQAGEDQELAQLLVDLAQDRASPEDGSLLSSQHTQDERKWEEDEEEDEDARDSLEMSQAWDGGSDEETTAELSRAVHSISASEEDTQDSQATIPQFDGGSDDKPEPTSKKSLGMRHRYQKLDHKVLSNPLGESSSTFSPFPPEIKTYGSKKHLMSRPEDKERISLTSHDTVQMQRAVFQHTRHLGDKDFKPRTQAQGMPPVMVSSKKIPSNPSKLRSTNLSKVTLKAKPAGTISKAVSQGEGPFERILPKPAFQDKASLKCQSSEPFAQDDNSSKKDLSRQVVQYKVSSKQHSSETVRQDKTLLRWKSPQVIVEDKASFTTSPMPSTSSFPPCRRIDSSVPELVKVPSNADAVHFTGCKELTGFQGLHEVKKDPMWNPVVMLIKCPIETDAKGKITFAGTSLPRQQLERIRRDNLKAQPFRRSSFSRKIVPPKRFMDEQYWMELISKMSKHKSEELSIDVDNTSTEKADGGTVTQKKHSRHQKHSLKMQGLTGTIERSEAQADDALETASEPPCLISPGRLKEVEEKQQMPVLEKMTALTDPCTTHHSEKPIVVTKTKAMLQEKYYKSLSSSDKKRKLGRSSLHTKLGSKKDAKRYRMLSRTFNKLSLSAQDPPTEGTSTGDTQSVPTTSIKLSITKSVSGFTSSVSTSALNNNERHDSLNPIQTSLLNSVHAYPSQGYSSNSNIPPAPLETPHQIKRRTSGTRKRRGSESSDDWAESQASQKASSHKRKSSQENKVDDLIFGKTYRFRKRERISYDDGDFPDVGFDIMCWSDKEDSEDASAQRPTEEHQIQRVGLEPVESSPKCSNGIQSNLQTKEATPELPWSPPRKRGRPPGSKNKSKLLKSRSFPKAGDGQSSPSSRAKSRLSFTVDSMLVSGANPSSSQSELVPTGSNKSSLITATSRSTTCGPRKFKPTVTQPRTIPSTVNQSHADTSTNERHTPRPRPQSISIAVNGHHSNFHEDSNEPALYRDAMWNLGYFSPRKKEKEGSPPRCWSPSAEMERSAKPQHVSAPEKNAEMKQSHKPSLVQECKESLKQTEHIKQGQRKKKFADDQSGSSDRDQRSNSGGLQEGKKAKHEQLVIITNSRTSKSSRDPESKQPCNTDIIDKDGKTKTSNSSDGQDTAMEIVENDKDVAIEKQTKAMHQDGKEVAKASCHGAVTDDLFSHDIYGKEASNSGISSQNVCINQGSRKTAVHDKFPIKDAPSKPKVYSAGDGGKVEKREESTGGLFKRDVVCSTTRQENIKSSSLTKATQERKDPIAIPHAHDSKHSLGSTLEVKGQSSREENFTADHSSPTVSLPHLTTAQRVNGEARGKDTAVDSSVSGSSEDTQTSCSPGAGKTMPSSHSPETLNSSQQSDEDKEALKEYSDSSRSPASDWGNKTSSSDSCYPPTGSDVESKSSFGAQVKCKQLSADKKPSIGGAMPIDQDQSLDLTSEDITPAQRKRKSPSEEEEEEEDVDSDDICNLSHSSSSTGASLSLDMSLIVSRVPSISPTREMVDPEESFPAKEQPAGQLGMHVKGIEKNTSQEVDHQANSVYGSVDQSSKPGEVLGALDLTCVTRKNWHDQSTADSASDRIQKGLSHSNHQPKDESSLASTEPSGGHRAASCDHFGQKLGSMSSSLTGSDVSLLEQEKDQIKGDFQVDGSVDSDTFSQLVCPESPSPRGSRDTTLSGQSQQKVDSHSDQSSSFPEPQSMHISRTSEGEIQPSRSSSCQADTHHADEKSSRGDCVVTNSKHLGKESSSKLDMPSFPNSGKEIESDEEVEPMEIDTSQEEHGDQDTPSRHHGDSMHPKIVLETEDYMSPAAHSKRSPLPSHEDHSHTPVQHTLPLPSSDNSVTKRIDRDSPILPRPCDKSSTVLSGGEEAPMLAVGQASESSAKERAESSVLSDHRSQVAKTHEGVLQQSKFGRTYPVQEGPNAEEVQNQTLHSCEHISQTVPVQPQTPVTSSLQNLTQRTHSTHPTSKEEDASLTLPPEEKSKVWTPAQSPPSAEMVQASLQEYGLPQLRHQRAFCGNPEDVHQPSKPGVHGDGHLETKLPSRLPEAESKLSQTGLNQWQANLMALKPHPLLSPSNVAPESGIKAALVGDRDTVITPCKSPPTVTQVEGWLREKNDKRAQDKKDKESDGDGHDAKSPERENMTPLNSVNKPSTSTVQLEGHTEAEGGSERLLHPAQQREHSVVSMPVTSHPSQDSLSSPQVHTPRMNLPNQQMHSTPSSKPAAIPKEGISTASPGSWIRNVTHSQDDTPRINPLARRGSSQPQHSTPLRVNTQSKEAGIPVTPISGWKRPTDPSSAGGSRERHPSTSSMRQSLLFTPAESSGVGKHCSHMSQIEGATPNNTCGFKMAQLNMPDARAVHEVQHLTIMSLELHVKTRRDYHPDPDFDPIRALFFSIQHDASRQTDETSAGCSHQQDDVIHGVIIVGESNHSNSGPSTSSSSQASLAHAGISNILVTSVTSENELLDEFLSIVRKHDPDILVGYEIQQHSWGYLLERAAFLDVDLCTQISRLPESKRESSFSSERDAYGADHQSEISIAGRITLNLWRLMRHEVALTNYTFENVAFHVLHQRVPLFTYRKLTDWFDHRHPELYRWRVIEYYSVRVRGSLKLLHQLDLVGRTSELARVFGIQFYSVLSRGSQFRVESMMLRTAKPLNYVAMSPSVQQRSRMKAPECIPLVMEPESRFYQDPVIVLDFQSLYPTMMIAYNYCFSTCLGRLEHIANGGQYVFGCGTLSAPVSQLKKLLQSDSLHVSPNGIVFVKPNVRRGVLPMMLEQILKLRLIVKKALKDFKDDKTLHRMLDSRQLALKLIANVTYGYTSANFSGRMPCIEVGDSVVRKARETLERAIHMVETTKKWGARVVYGDTDSMFVLVKGASKERAFEIGKEIRDAVTAANPKPVKLKLEKVYHPCVLQSKKRYVGYSYESPDQAEPDFDAKGIETVRRDSCPAVGKILERALKILFTTRDVSQIKQYVQKQFQKILDGQASMQDLIFAKEYHGRHFYRPGACVPSLEISKRLLAVDRRAEPRVGQRVPYVVVYGSPGLPLIQLVRTPDQVLQDPSLRLNTTYYLTRQLVPSLNRVFGLLGVDTMQWYQELPRWHRVSSHHQPGTPGKKGTISQYFASLNCVICEKVTKESLCGECKAKGQVTATALLSRVQQWQLLQQDMAKICASCCNFSQQDTNSCVSLDCPIMFKTNKLVRQLGQAPHYLQLLDGL